MFAAMEECSGLRGDFDRIHWFRSPDHSLGGAGAGTEAVARWVGPHDIFLASRVVQIEAVSTIEHEMLHDITQSPEHGEVFTRCRVL